MGNVGGADKVAWVAGVRVAPVAVAGDGRLGDHVVTRQQVAAFGNTLQIGVVEADPGIEHRDDHLGPAGRDGPGCFGVDRRLHGATGRPQIPLPDRRPGAGRLAIGVQGVVRCAQAPPPLVDDDRFDVAIGRQAANELGRAEPAREHHLPSIRHVAAAAQAEAQTPAEHAGPLGAELRGVLCALGRRHRLPARQRRVGLEGDDDARLGLPRGLRGERRLQ